MFNAKSRAGRNGIGGRAVEAAQIWANAWTEEVIDINAIWKEANYQFSREADLTKTIADDEATKAFFLAAFVRHIVWLIDAHNLQLITYAWEKAGEPLNRRTSWRRQYQ